MSESTNSTIINPDNQNTNPPSDIQKQLDAITKQNNDLATKLKDAETKFTTASTELSNLKKQGLKSAGDWEQLAKTNEEEANKWKTKYTTTGQALIHSKRMEAITAAAVKEGIDPSFIPDLANYDFQNVKVDLDETNLLMNVTGAELAVQNLKKIRPKLFNDAAPPAFNPGGGKVIQPGDVASIQAKYQQALKNRAKDPIGYKKAFEEYHNALSGKKVS